MYPRRGMLTCSMSVFVRLDPSEKATFTLENADPVKEGDTVTMKCETDGNPQPEFEFTKDVRVLFLCVRQRELCDCVPNHYTQSLPNVSCPCPSTCRETPSSVKTVSWWWNLSSAQTLASTCAQPSISTTWRLTWVEQSISMSTVSGARDTKKKKKKRDTRAHKLQNCIKNRWFASCLRRLVLAARAFFSSVHHRIKRAETEWALMESFRLADIQFNFSQFIWYFNVIPTTPPNLILSHTLSGDSLEIAWKRLNLGFKMGSTSE